MPDSPSYACLQLTRPANCAIAGASVLAGAFVADAQMVSWIVMLAVISEGCLCAGANVINDCYDIEIDRLNKRMRPLVTGRVSRRSAVVFAVLLNAIGIGIGAYLGPFFLGLGLFTVLGAVAYSAVLKPKAIVGNITVSLTASLAFLYGGLTGPHPYMAMIPTVFALLFHLGREILKDIEDMTGDAAVQSGTIPLSYGTQAARNLITGTFAVLILMTGLPYLLGWYDGLYLSIVVLVDLIIVYVLCSIWRDASPGNAGRLSRILKVNMVIGLIAICLGR